MREFKDKVAVITGGASGIGLALADRLASVGMKIVIADIEEGPLHEAEQKLKSKGRPVLAVATDVSKADSVEALAERTYETFGATHVLCNNAGVGTGGLLWEHTRADWDWVFGVNFFGVVNGVRAFVPRMLAQDTEGHIVNTASIAGLISSPYISIYQASKHAVIALTESLKMELETYGSKLSASVLCPGFVVTRLADSERNRPEDLAGSQREGDIDRQHQVRELARQQVAEGMKPTEVAEKAVEAIREDRFYVLTHARYQKLIRKRMDNILGGKNPKYEP